MRTVAEIESQFLGSGDRWNETVIQRLIDDKVQERFDLEYKSAQFLVLKHNNNGEKRRDSITSRVSAMANSAGGVVIFGISEDSRNRHLPSHIDPIQQNDMTRETLDQIISQIQPTIPKVRICPVSINGSDELVVYVVVVPQSTTAHQSTDLKYYTRSNDRTVAMRDDQIRDVMNRVQHPKIMLKVDFIEYGGRDNDFSPETSRYQIVITAVNNGTRLAKNILCFIQVPLNFNPVADRNNPHPEKDFMTGNWYNVFIANNLMRVPMDDNGRAFLPYYDPILPGTSMRLREIELRGDPGDVDESIPIKWRVFADNAPVESGESKFRHCINMRKGLV